MLNVRERLDLSLAAAISKGNQTLLEGLLSIDQITDRIQSMYRDRDIWQIPYVPTSAVATEPEDVFFSRIGSFLVAGEINLGEILESIISSMNGRRLFHAALAVRSLLELTASFVYFEKNAITPLRDGAATQKELAEALSFMIKFNGAGRFDWDRWTASPESARTLMADYSKDPKIRPEPEQTNVLTMIGVSRAI